ncbi:hypothetical protein AOLI_G00274400 [Acnodon oligacanthus]
MQIASRPLTERRVACVSAEADSKQDSAQTVPACPYLFACKPTNTATLPNAASAPQPGIQEDIASRAPAHADRNPAIHIYTGF